MRNIQYIWYYPASPLPLMYLSEKKLAFLWNTFFNISCKQFILIAGTISMLWWWGWVARVKVVCRPELWYNIWSKKCYKNLNVSEPEPDNTTNREHNQWIAFGVSKLWGWNCKKYIFLRILINAFIEVKS